MSADFLDLGAASLDPATNALLVQAKTTQIGEDPDDAPDIGDAPMMGALGVTAFPYPSNDDGGAQGVKVDLPGTNGVIVAARDTRTADVTAQLGPGETCVHSTGPDFDSRVFLKEKSASIIVGDSMAIVVDEKNQKITISCFGGHFEISKQDGCYMAHGGAMIQAKDGMCILTGKIMLGGRTPVGPVQFGTVPVIGTAGACAPAPGVFVGT